MSAPRGRPTEGTYALGGEAQSAKGVGATTNLSRRRFLGTSAAAAGSLVVGFHVPFVGEALAQGTAPAAPSAATPEINAWVVVRPDDTVVIRIARSEMGQGSLTGLAQLVAEELDCDWSKVTTEYPTPGQNLARNRVWGNFSTGGSRGIRDSQEYVRKGGAMARMMLVQAAASGWNAPVSECAVARGVITHTPSGRTTTYGKVAVAAAKVAPPTDVPLKDPKDWKLVGKRLARLDTVDKVTGAQIYGLDFKLPGMLNAAIKDCPVFGGTVKSVDTAAALKRPGVKKVVRVGDSAVAVVADTWWHAKSALDALSIEWDNGPNANASSASFAEVMKAGLDAKDAAVGNEVGDARAAIAAAPRKIEAVYSYPHQNHATMETMNATARWTPERCEVWTPTQNGEAALAAASEAAELPLAKCDVYKLLLGGGFGRRGAVHDWVRQVVAIAKEMPGTPVKLIWSREEDMLHGRYHPVTQCKLTAGLDAAGNVTALHMRISGQSIVAAIFPANVKDGKDPVVFQGLNPPGPEASIGYTFPNLLIDHAMRNPSVPPGFWRGVNLNQNTIYLECFIDEIAYATKQDPLALRRKLMANHPKHLAVLNAVAERIGWDKPAPKGVYRGLAQTMGFGSYVAACAEVSVSGDGALKVHRIVAATDPGYAVNPQQIEAQVEGSFAYGLSAALYGECTVKGGRIEQENFNSYQVLRMNEMPAVETIVMPSGGFWGGVGEPTIAVAAPAVLNAIFAATGKRIRDLPLKNHSLKTA
jgi:isoquinoline 1-oxidoreductase beta subunit